MNRHRCRLASLSLAAIVAIAWGGLALANPTCADLEYGSPKHGDSMDALARRAKLPDAAWNREHESVVAELCAGRIDEIHALVDDGAVSAAEVSRIAAVLGKPYTQRKRSESGKRFAAAKAKFADMGACNACADNIAQYYVNKPGSRCAKLAKRAVAGDAEAIDKLADFPDYCEWKY